MKLSLRRLEALLDTSELTDAEITAAGGVVSRRYGYRVIALDRERGFAQLARIRMHLAERATWSPIEIVARDVAWAFLERKAS
jgi:hypothetical protein